MRNAANIEKQCIANVRGQYKTLNATEILLQFDVHKLEALTTTEHYSILCFIHHVVMESQCIQNQFRPLYESMPLYCT